MFYENNIQVVDNYLAHKKYDGLNAFFQSSRHAGLRIGG